MTTLNDILIESKQIEALLENSGGELTDVLSLRIIDNVAALRSKVDAIYHVKSSLRADVERLKQMRDEISARIDTRQDAVKRLDAHLKQEMLNADMRVLEGDRYKFTIANGAPTVTIDESLLPKEYLMTITTVEPDRARIREELKTGRVIPGTTVTQGKSLTGRLR